MEDLFYEYKQRPAYIFYTLHCHIVQSAFVSLKNQRLQALYKITGIILWNMHL
ncbi:hypothetical protein UUU_35330 [Klebsiella pneumoniae subsp. pneumoniae DSM 30104 = JCM 1662 = NBRC 14940]|nr:hypothetical protein UUU_35330 [Klebsiella pneumoniae subsp. pneumoniae DSM 30104 = JCM 1662 = NBRC 14940]